MDSPRAFFQFPIGFSLGGTKRCYSARTSKLSIPYRILTGGKAVYIALWHNYLSIPYRILTSLKAAVWYSEGTFNSLSDSHWKVVNWQAQRQSQYFQFPIGFSLCSMQVHLIGYVLSIPYRILTGRSTSSYPTPHRMYLSIPYRILTCEHRRSTAQHEYLSIPYRILTYSRRDR